MGISNLIKNLIVLEESYIIQNLYNKDYYDNLINILGNPNLRSHNCHVDFSLFLYKILLTSESMEQAVRKILLFFKDLSKYNNIFIYLDPKTNIRKKSLQNKRFEVKQKTLKRIKNDINKIFNNNNINNNFTDEIKQIIFKNEFNNYDENLKFFNKNIITKDKNIKFLNIETSNNIDDDIEIFNNVEQININDIRKKTFSIFLNSFNFIYHQEYILNILKNTNILPLENIIISKNYDAELNIINYIVTNNLMNNIIFSADQDVILFSLFHLKSHYIYIKNDINLETSSLNIISNNNLNKNISYLIIFFNKSDYFNGIEKFKITPEKLLNLKNKYIYFKKLFSYKFYENKIELIGTFLQFFKKKDLKNDFKNDIIFKINNYLEKINQYLEMSVNFYLNIDNELENINILELLKFLEINNPLITVYKNNNESENLLQNNIEYVLWNDI